jgi:hypothetical protein
LKYSDDNGTTWTEVQAGTDKRIPSGLTFTGQCLDEKIVKCLYLDNPNNNANNNSQYYITDSTPHCRTPNYLTYSEKIYNWDEVTKTWKEDGTCPVGYKRGANGSCDPSSRIQCGAVDEYSAECCEGNSYLRWSNDLGKCYSVQEYECRVLINRGNPYDETTVGMIDFSSPTGIPGYSGTCPPSTAITGYEDGCPLSPSAGGGGTVGNYVDKKLYNSESFVDLFFSSPINYGRVNFYSNKCVISCDAIRNSENERILQDAGFFQTIGPGGITTDPAGHFRWTPSQKVSFSIPQAGSSVPYLSLDTASQCNWECVPHAELSNGVCDCSEGYTWNETSCKLEDNGNPPCSETPEGCDTDDPDDPAYNTNESAILDQLPLDWETGGLDINNTEDSNFLSPAKTGIEDFILRVRIPTSIIEGNESSFSGDSEILKWSIQAQIPDPTLSSHDPSDPSNYTNVKLMSVPRCFAAGDTGGALCTSHFSSSGTICTNNSPDCMRINTSETTTDPAYTIIEIKNPTGVLSHNAEYATIQEFFDTYDVYYPSLVLEYVNPPKVSDNNDKLRYIEYQMFMKGKAIDNGISTLPGGTKVINATATIQGLKQSIDIRIEDKEKVPFLYYAVTY